jgi:hypothetical protein
VLDALEEGVPLQDANEDAQLRGVLTASFNTVSVATQNMVGACVHWRRSMTPAALFHITPAPPFTVP